MGSFTFVWDVKEPETTDTSDILVTGSFDGWTKSVRLEKNDDVWQKTVHFSEKDVSSKIYYKFVVDNTWIINYSYPHEPDHDGNINNFFTAEDLNQSTSSIAPTTAGAPFINTVTPESTTVTEMAKKKNGKKAAAANKPPSDAAVAAATAAAPTPAVADSKEPIATPSDVPGGFPATPLTEDTKLEDKTFSVKPLPATAGIGNPIKLAPGEKIPDSITTQDVNANVTLDKASYENSAERFTAPALDPLAAAVPPVSGTVIPESSLPMGQQADVTNVTINSAGAGATTAALAGQVPLEPKVPALVKESQQKAGVAPEASASAAEVKEKAKVEEEIKATIPEAPATSVGTAGVGTEKKENTGTIVGAVAATGGAAVAAAAAAVTKFSQDAAPVVSDATNATVAAIKNNVPDTVKDKLPVSAQNALAAEKSPSPLQEVSPQVPREVKESIAEAGKSPEAAANTIAVQEKKEVESELLRQVLAAPSNQDAAAKAGASKPAQAESKTAATEAAATPAVSSPAAAVASETKADTPTGSPAAANGNGTESKPSDSTTQKKKNRLSVMLGKLKAKLK